MNRTVWTKYNGGKSDYQVDVERLKSIADDGSKDSETYKNLIYHGMMNGNSFCQRYLRIETVINNLLGGTDPPQVCLDRFIEDPHTEGHDIPNFIFHFVMDGLRFVVTFSDFRNTYTLIAINVEKSLATKTEEEEEEHENIDDEDDEDDVSGDSDQQ